MAGYRATRWWVVLCVCLTRASFSSAQSGAPTGAMVQMHGVQLSLPEGYRAQTDATAAGVQRVFTRDGELLVFVMQPAPADARKSASTAAFSVDHYARGYAAALEQKLGLESITEAAGLAHDAKRGAARARFQVNGPAQAAMLLAVDDSHAAWEPLRRDGVDRKQLRCLVSALLGGRQGVSEASLRRNADAAAQRCGRSLAEVTTFIDASLTTFAPVPSALEAITFFTRSATVQVLVVAPLSRAADAAELASQLWERAHIQSSARPELSLFASLAGTGLFDGGRLVGIVLGAFIAVFGLGAVFAWALARGLGLAPRRAVLCSLLILLTMSLIGSVGTAGVSQAAGVQLLAYAAASGLAFRPLARWLGRGSAGIGAKHA